MFKMASKLSHAIMKGNLNVCTRFNGNPSNSCWDISLSTRNACTKCSLRPMQLCFHYSYISVSVWPWLWLSSFVSYNKITLKPILINITRWTGMIIQHPFHLQIAPNFSAIIPLTQVPLKEPCLMEYGSSVVSYMHHVHHNPHTNTFTISSLLKIWPLLEAAIFWQKWERFQCIQMYSREMDHAARVAWKVYLEV